MATEALPRDLLVAAEVEVERTLSQLQAARVQARSAKTRIEWLSDRPELLRFARLIDDLPRLREDFTRAQNELQHMYEERIRKKTKASPFEPPPDLKEGIAVYRRLFEAKDDVDTDARLLALYSEPALPAWLRAAIADRVKSMASAKRYADWADHPGSRSKSWFRFYSEEIKKSDEQWNFDLGEIHGILRTMERNRDELAKKHASEVRSSVEAELAAKNAEVDRDRKVLAEANDASAHQPEIDRFVADRIDAYVEEMTCTARQAYSAALQAVSQAQRECVAQFHRRMVDDFMTARVDDFTPPNNHALHRELEEAKTIWIIEWASRNTRQRPDPEQAAAIGCMKQNVLVTARAGSGKTSTLVSRAAFLVKHCRIPPSELLLLVFNKSASEEMRNRLQQIGCDVPNTMTFHALAYAIVHPEEAIIYDSPDGRRPELSRAFQRVIDQIMDEDQFREDVRRVMLDHFRADWDMLNKAGLTLSRAEGLEFRRALAGETLRGEYVKSFGEKALANFLFEHDIPYQYERNHWWDGRNYRPDFTIPEGEHGNGIVIEYFGLTGDPDYDIEAGRKREYWRGKTGWQLIEVVPSDLAGGLTAFENTMRHRLSSCGISPSRLPEEEIWMRIRDRAITKFAAMASTFVGRCRKSQLSPRVLSDRIGAHSPLSEAEAVFLRIAAEILTRYLDRLSAVGEEDFDGLLERAALEIEDGRTVFDRKSGKGDLCKIRFVMVDEFQDFSPLFFRILRAACQRNPRMSMFCVGDDWQAINAFAGSDLNYFTRFDTHFPPATLLPLTINYRSAPCVVEFGNLLMQGRGIQGRPGTDKSGQIMIADLSQFVPSAVERELHPNVAITPVVRRILSKALKDGGHVAILARLNRVNYYLGKDAKGATLEAARDEWTRGFSDEQRERISVSTAHRFKGLQAETVLILDAVQRSYPLIHPNWVFTRILGDSVEKLAEDERRLFYVACTRTVSTLILITESGSESPFLCAVKNKCVGIDWQAFPPVATGACRWTVQVGSWPGLGSKPTYSVKEELKACMFRFVSGEWSHWQRTYPASDAGLEALVKSLGRDLWAKKGRGLKLRICDQNGTVLGVFRVDGDIIAHRPN